MRVKLRRANLKPLEPDIHKTGRWTFSGKNLPPDEVRALSDKGVNWEIDVMPDGRLKHPRFRSDVIKKKLAGREVKESSIDAAHSSSVEEYNSLPDPKPDYFAWQFERDKPELYRILKKTAKMPQSSENARIRAIGLMFEFFQPKPKTTLELKDGDNQVAQLDATELLRLACEINHVDFEQFKQLLDNRATTQ